MNDESTELTFRSATLDDAELLLKWRNNLETRLASINSDMISKEDHIKWFTKLITKNNIILLIAEKNNKPVGTIRIEIKNNIKELSWTVAPAQRGKGIGKLMLYEIVRQLNGNLIAKIKKENIPSVKMAEYAGFKLDHESDGLLFYIKA